MFDGNVEVNVCSFSNQCKVYPIKVLFNIYDDTNIVGWNTDITEEEEAEAVALLKKELSKGDKFIASGHRNDTAVNMCIALHVLGIFEIAQWFSKFFNKLDERFDKDEVDYFMDHVERVLEYIDIWGPEGAEGDALGYTL